MSTNNVLNPFTLFGDCFDMITAGAARLLRLPGYGIAVGNPADIVVLDCKTPETAVRELAAPLYGLKGGRRTVTRRPAEFHRPK